VARFLASQRAKQLSAAKRDFVELEFLLAWPPGDSSSDRLRLTGFIDRLYEDREGQWHILDFKTNRVDAATLPAVAANYELQMLVYALAAQQVLGQPPKTLTLHMLRSGDEFAFAWNDAARTRVRKMVDEAIARLRGPLA
jgi:ATP-dependent exoDNAse (exonuclease V) beta subunit